ncbi:MAG: UvrD-helicase domain-containing protein [Anaerolineales bacterium]|nr:UvrD-helicase domain-containing protein [Anaerolineales bacterium]
MLKKSILNQLDPSPEQTKPILQRNQDIVVTAGAGTGKTRTLVARYLSLLEENVPLREIVAITFTKKAAREMRNRIREEVRIYLHRPDLREDEQRYWRDIYENLDAARISTIHSLATDILRQHPAELGLDPKFELLDEGQAARLKARAVEAALAWGSEDSDAAVIFPLYGDWKLRRVVSELLSKRLDIGCALDKSPDDIWQLWEPYLIKPLQSFVDDREVISAMDEFLEYETNGILERAHANGDLFADDLRIVINNWKKIKQARKSSDWITISRCLSPLRIHLKQKGRKDNWAPGNPRELIKLIQPIFDNNIAFDKLDLALDQKLARDIIPGVKAVFQYANQWYDTAKDQLNGLDFDDLENFSLKLLKDFPSVKEFWQEKISALLVDEYQDINNRQRELVNTLNGNGKRLFIVGDGKQSIYRFRGADVAVFRQEQETISLEGSSFQLATSYRAHTKLINDLNSLMGPVLGLDTSLPYVEPFAPLSPGRIGLPRYGGQPYIELHLAAGTKADGAGRTAAEAVAARIIDIIERSKSNDSEDPDRKLKYGDVAVLCRASGSFPVFESAFEKAGIPYLTIAGQGFYDRPEIRDLLNALTAFADTQNDLAVAGLMRSPVIGLTDDALLLFRDLQREKKISSLFEAVKDNIQFSDGEISERAKYLVIVVEKYSNLVGRISAADILSRFLEESGYLAALAMGGHHRNIQNMRKLVSDAQNSGVVSVPDFLNTIAELKKVTVREGEASSVAEGSVQIMTVHQAKGLEFPIVILGDASKKDRFGRDILIDPVLGIVPPLSDTRIVENDPKLPYLVTASSLAYEIALKEERARDEAESNRLFYVAATRAQELLIISGVLGKLNKDQALGKMGGWLEKIALVLGLRDLPLKFRVDGNSIYKYEVKENGIEANITVYENRFDFGLVNKYKEFIVDPVPVIGKIPNLLPEQPRPFMEKEKLISGLYRATSRGEKLAAPARIVGDVVHRALQLWKFPDQGENEFIDWVAAELKSQGVIREREIKNGYRRVKNILERFQGHELFIRMDSAEKLLHEIPYSVGESNEPYQSGVIDAMFRESGRWFIIEFKTDEIRDMRRFDWVWQNEDYQQQVEKYIRAAELVLGEKPEAILCFLNYEKRIHLVDDQW